MSGSWVERGVVVEMVSPTVTDFGLEVSELQNPASLLPDSTLGFMAASFDPNVDNWRKALAEYDLRDVLPDPQMLDEINANLVGMAPDGTATIGTMTPRWRTLLTWVLAWRNNSRASTWKRISLDTWPAK